MAQGTFNSLFPTPVYTHTTDVYDLKAEEKDFISKLEFQENRLNHRSLDSYVLDREDMASLRNHIDHHLQIFFRETWQPGNEVSLKITQSWVNKCFPGEAHHKHAHTNSVISGVFYLNADPSTDKIFFDNGTYDPLQIAPVEFNIWNSTSWYFPVTTGMLVLFPSHLLHFVDAVEGSNERDVRMSLSFNTFFEGTIGSEFLLSELKL
jgi:uncharacterized protein (TIGR02466 family)